MFRVTSPDDSAAIEVSQRASHVRAAAARLVALGLRVVLEQSDDGGQTWRAFV